MIFELIEKMIWSGIAAAGFALLFNVPLRTLFALFAVSAFAGLIKFTGINFGFNIALSSLFAASFVGFASIPIARYRKTSPFIISIPSVIPMIPGYFGYKTLLGIMVLSVNHNSAEELKILMSVIHNALNMAFILFSLSIGVSLPWFILRKKTRQYIKLSSENDLL